MISHERLATLVIVGVLGLSSTAPTAAQTVELIPNLRVAGAFDVDLREDFSTSGWKIVFSTLSYNVGDGPLELVAGETGSVGQNVYQRVFLSDGSSYDRIAGTFEWHPEHSHVHFDNYAMYTLQPYMSPGGSMREGHKTTFCVMDTDHVDSSLSGSPNNAVYSTCAADIQGMSVGWGDTYGSHLADQDIDVTGLPSGDYELTIEVDPFNRLLEKDDTDNTSLVFVRLDFNAKTAKIITDPGGSGDPGDPDPQVLVSGISPSGGNKDSVFNVEIAGEGFGAGMPVQFENGSGPAPVLSNVSYVDENNITARVTIKRGGRKKASTWDLRVGNGVLQDAFTVQP